MYNAVIVDKSKLNSIKHPNADRLVLVFVDGVQVAISTETWENNNRFVYFPQGGQLTEEFVKQNKLDRAQGGFLELNRHVKAISLRSEKSYGLLLPLSCLNFLSIDLELSDLNEGLEFQEINGIKICDKYITPDSVNIQEESELTKLKKNKSFIGRIKYRLYKYIDSFKFKRRYSDSTKYFSKHIETQKAERNLSKIFELYSKGYSVIVTEKFHGTSFRIAYVESEQASNTKWMNKLTELFSKYFDLDIKFYEKIHGSKNVVFTKKAPNSFRQLAFDVLSKYLNPGEVIYGEFFGYQIDKLTKSEHEINSNCKVIQKQGVDKDFTKHYPNWKNKSGSTMNYTYGMNPGQLGCLIYRITQNGKDLSYRELKVRSSELRELVSIESYKNFEIVPMREIGVGLFQVFEDDVISILNKNFDGDASNLDQNHLLEGLVFRVEKPGQTPMFFKWVTPAYKFLSTGQHDFEDVQ